MSKEELKNIFMELIEEWECAELDLDSEFSCYETKGIGYKKQDYINRFNKTLEKL